MTHASRTHEALARAEEIKDQLARSVEHIEALKAKLDAAEQEIEMQLLLTDLASLLRELPTRNMSEGQRLRLKGLRKRLDTVRAA